MLYRTITAANLGYVHPDTTSPVVSPVEIALLDNGPDEEFVHLGYAYPDLSGVTVRLRVESGGPLDDKVMLIAYEGDELTEGTAVAEAAVVAVLVAEYGWPEGTTMDGDGMPVAPEPEL